MIPREESEVYNRYTNPGLPWKPRHLISIHCYSLNWSGAYARRGRIVDFLKNKGLDEFLKLPNIVEYDGLDDTVVYRNSFAEYVINIPAYFEWKMKLLNKSK